MTILDSVINYFACPNDGGYLMVSSHSLVCKTCNEKFKIINENTVDLISKNSPTELDFVTDWYRKFYFDTKKTGASNLPSSLQHTTFLEKRRIGYVIQALKIIKKFTKDQIVCDIGAGRGDYSVLLANEASLTFHCDLDMKSINTAREEANRLGLKNIVFVRCDYFHLPFRLNSIPFITCFGSLFRGKDHDVRALKQLSRTIKNDGIIFVNFLAKERNKITHGKASEFKYTKNELTKLFDKFNLKIVKIQGLSYVLIPPTMDNLIRKLPFPIYNTIDSVLKLFLPPASWFIIAKSCD